MKWLSITSKEYNAYSQKYYRAYLVVYTIIQCLNNNDKYYDCSNDMHLLWAIKKNKANIIWMINRSITLITKWINFIKMFVIVNCWSYQALEAFCKKCNCWFWSKYGVNVNPIIGGFFFFNCKPISPHYSKEHTETERMWLQTKSLQSRDDFMEQSGLVWVISITRSIID